MTGKMKLACGLRSEELAGALDMFLINDEIKLIDMLGRVWDDFFPEVDDLLLVFRLLVAASVVKRDDV